MPRLRPRGVEIARDAAGSRRADATSDCGARQWAAGERSCGEPRQGLSADREPKEEGRDRCRRERCRKPRARAFTAEVLDGVPRHDQRWRLKSAAQHAGGRKPLISPQLAAPARHAGGNGGVELTARAAARSIAASAIGRASAVCRSGVRTRAVGTRPQIRRSESEAASQRGREGRPGRAAAVCDLHLNTPPRLAAARCDGDQRMGQGGNVHRMLSGGSEGGDQGAHERREEGVGATRRRACRAQQPATRGRTCTWSCACAWARSRVRQGSDEAA